MTRHFTRLACSTGLALLDGRRPPSAARRPRPASTRIACRPIADPGPILADHPRFVEPIREAARFEAPALVNDPGADLEVRAWRFSYNARGIIEVPNHLRADRTAVIVVHPWGIDDGQGWRTPEPAGVAFQCTPGEEPDRPRARRDGHRPAAQAAPRRGSAW